MRPVPPHNPGRTGQRLARLHENEGRKEARCRKRDEPSLSSRCALTDAVASRPHSHPASMTALSWQPEVPARAKHPRSSEASPSSWRIDRSGERNEEECAHTRSPRTIEPGRHGVGARRARLRDVTLAMRARDEGSRCLGGATSSSAHEADGRHSPTSMPDLEKRGSRSRASAINPSSRARRRP